MNKENWLKVEEALSHPYGFAKLKCDSYNLTLVVQQTKALKFEIGFYVDGYFRGIFLTQDCEERRRFCCPHQASVYSPASRAKITKGVSKRNVSKWFPDIDKKFTYYGSHWSKFAPLKRHLIANNEVIELLETC